MKYVMGRLIVLINGCLSSTHTTRGHGVFPTFPKLRAVRQVIIANSAGE